MTISRKDLKKRADNVHSDRQKSELDRIKERREETITHIEQCCIQRAAQGYYEYYHRFNNEQEWKDLRQNKPESFRELKARFYESEDPDYHDTFYYVYLTWN